MISTAKLASYVMDAVMKLHFYVLRPVLKISIITLLSLWGCTVYSGCGRQEPATDMNPEPLLVFAAASLTDVLREIASDYETSGGQKVVFNLAGSGTLARQIEAGVPADVFLSANEHWMDVLQQSGHVKIDSRFDWLMNPLVVVAHQQAQIHYQTPLDLREAEIRYVAVGDPAYVPAGTYAQQWLQQIRLPEQQEGKVEGVHTLWQALSETHRLTFASDVRSAVQQVLVSRSSVGIVYRTDYLAFQDDLQLLDTVPVESGVVARYSAAILTSSRQTAQASDFLNFLRSATARNVLEQAGFELQSDANHVDVNHR